MSKFTIRKMAILVLGAVLNAMAHGETVLSGGTSAYVDIGTPEVLQLPNNAPFTVEGWMLFKTISTRDMLCSKSNGRVNGPYSWLVGFADNKIAAYNTGWQGNFAVTRQLNRWYHTAYSFNGTSMAFYLDGELIGAAAFSFANNTNHSVKIGGYGNGSDSNGYKSDVRIWNYARSGFEIRQEMNRRLHGDESGLIGYWPLNDGVGTIAHDATANGSDGTLVGAAWAYDPSLALAKPDDPFSETWPFYFGDTVTGSTRFSNSNEIDIASIAVPRDYDMFQVVMSGDITEIDSEGWLSTNSLPARLSFSKPNSDTNLTAYIWFTNSTEEVGLKRAAGTIRYTLARPVPVVNAYYHRELDETGSEVTLHPARFDRGTTGGFSGGQTIAIHGIRLNLVGGPGTNATPAEPWITLQQAGAYQLELVARNEAGNISTSAVFTVNVTTWSGPQTEGNVEWSGGAGASNRYWNVASNWVGNAAPADPLPGTVYFKAAAHDITSKLEADRMVGQIIAGVSGVTVLHTIDLNNHTLTVTNLLRGGIIAQAQTGTLAFTNGTVCLGTANAAAVLDSRRGMVDFNRHGVWLETRNLAAITLLDGGWAGAAADLRNIRLVNNLLRVKKLDTPGRDSPVYINNSISGSTLHVMENLELLPLLGTAYIGDPGKPYSLGGGNVGYFPGDVDIILGVPGEKRATVLAARTSPHSAVRCSLNVDGGGGHLTAYVGTMKIGYNEGALYATYGMLDFADMDSCAVNVENLWLGTDRPAALPTDDMNGTLRLPAGTALLGNVVVGGAGVGKALLGLSNTLATVSGTLTLNPTARLEIKTGANSRGLGITGSLLDNGGRVAVAFMDAAPPATTNWALRLAGNAVVKLGSLQGSGRLTATGISEGKKAGVIYDNVNDTTMFAMVDADVPLSLMAIAREELEVEKIASRDVLLAASEIDNGSYDPDGNPVTLSVSVGGGPFAEQLVFDNLGDYVVTLKVATETASATDTCLVRVVEAHPGTNDNLIWTGEASTLLMERREWLWSGNWQQGVPPANPYFGTISFMYPGQSVSSVLEADRTIYRLDAGELNKTVKHTFDLNGRTLTISDRLFLRSSATTDLVFTNGTLCLGDISSATLQMYNHGSLTIAPGTIIDTANTSEIYLGGSAWAHIPLLDLRGAVVAGGVLAMNKLRMPCTSWYGARFYLNDTTSIDTISVAEAFEIGNGNLNANVPQYIGDPGNTFKWGTATFGLLPSGLNLSFGKGPKQRASMIVGESNYPNKTFAVIRAAGGGTITAWLSQLKLGMRSSQSGAISIWGMLHLAAMESCQIDIDTAIIATGRADAQSTDDERGELWLPPGTATFGTVTMGASDGVGNALIWASNTTVTVTNTMTLNATARVELSVGDNSGGLRIERTDATALEAAEGAKLTLHFTKPAAERPHYALRWNGNHQEKLSNWIDNGTLTIDDAGLGRRASVFMTGPVTYIGLPPPGGTMILLR